MVFFPPQFGDFGKKAKDLLKKKYDFGNSLKVTNKATDGLTVETGAKGLSSGYCKITKALADIGPLEAELGTCGAMKGSITLEKLVDNVEVKICGDLQKCCGSVTGKYKRDMFSGSAAISSDSANAKLTLSGVVGSNGVCVGGLVAVDLTAGAGEVDGMAIGCEYSQADRAASLIAADKLDKVTLALYQKVSADCLLSASLGIDASKDARRLEVGTQYTLDDTCLLKAKANNAGILTFAAEQYLSSPSMKLCLAAAFDANQNFDTTTFGINVSLGDV